MATRDPRADRRELAIDIMASWALEGMEPDAEMLEDINAYVDGTMTTDDIITKAKNGGYRG